MADQEDSENCKMEEKTVKKGFTRRWCSVPHCKIRNFQSLHKFPRDPELKKTWAIACRIGKKVSEYMLVCRDHFLPTDFIPRWDGKLKRLKTIAIPSQNLPSRPLDKKLTPAQMKRKEDRAIRATKRLQREDPRRVPGLLRNALTECKKSKNVSIKNNDKLKRSMIQELYDETDDSIEHTNSEQNNSIIISNDKFERNKEHNEMDHTYSNEHNYVNDTCECDTNELINGIKECYEVKAAKILLELNEKVYEMMENKDLIFPVKDLILKRGEEFYFAARRFHKTTFFPFLKNDHQLNAFTGIDFNLLHILTEAVTMCEDDSSVKYELSVKERIVLSLIKLRLNLSFRSIANLFQLSESNCKTLFNTTLQSLKSILKSAIYWPTKDEIMKSMPESLENFKKTIVVIDRNEITVERLTCPRCQLPIISDYNDSEKLKILLGFAKCGLITYVGKAQQGVNASNETIDDQSFISKILVPSRDAIMTDGLFIEEDCNKLFIELIKSRKEKPFNPDALFKDKVKEGLDTHIENAYKRFRRFKVLHSTISCDMASFIDDISVVISGIVNLSNPVIVNKKF